MLRKSPFTDLRWQIVLMTCVAVLALVISFQVTSAARSDVDPVPQQDVIRLEGRLNQVEQRMYLIESSLRNLEQQSRLGAVTSRSVDQQQLTILQSEIKTLQQRVVDDECALAKLDERTLSPAMREARRKSGARSDACRLNSESPLRLPERQ